VAKLYVQVPLVVSNTNDSTGEITVLNHDFSVANEVMFTGDDIDDAGLVEGNVYSVESVPAMIPLQSTNLSTTPREKSLPINQSFTISEIILILGRGLKRSIVL